MQISVGPRGRVHETSLNTFQQSHSTDIVIVVCFILDVSKSPQVASILAVSKSKTQLSKSSSELELSMSI